MKFVADLEKRSKRLVKEHVQNSSCSRSIWTGVDGRGLLRAVTTWRISQLVAVGRGRRTCLDTKSTRGLPPSSLRGRGWKYARGTANKAHRRGDGHIQRSQRNKSEGGKVQTTSMRLRDRRIPTCGNGRSTKIIAWGCQGSGLSLRLCGAEVPEN